VRAKAWLPAAVGCVVVVATWWLVVIVFDVSSFVFPSPSDIVRSFADMHGLLMHHTWRTVAETVVGFGLAVLIALPAAMLLTAYQLVERAVLPLLVGANAIPKIAIAPLLVVWLGFGSLPKIVMVILIAFFPIVVAAMSGLSSTPVELVDLARSLSASRLQMFAKMRIPWALPQIFVGLKLAVALAVVGAVVGEFAGGDQGLGYLIVASGASGDTPLAFAAMVLLSVLSVLLFYLVAGLERLLLPWAREITG
jgi:NitT/TauT family transport system permease protein